MASHDGSGFVLRTLTTDDIPACARLAGLAFQTDRQTQFKASNKNEPYDHETAIQGALSHWIHQRPQIIELTVAADTLSGDAVGFVAWGCRGFEPLEVEGQHTKQEINFGKPSKQSIVADKTETTPSKQSQPTSARERLEAHTGADMARWMERLMPPGTRCMYICSISVLPEFQGKGIGSALIRKGTDRADTEGVFCWVHASEEGRAIFAKHGFQGVGTLSLDLDAWNTEGVSPPEGDGSSWGTYIFTYMVRDAAS